MISARLQHREASGPCVECGAVAVGHSERDRDEARLGGPLGGLVVFLYSRIITDDDLGLWGG